MIHSSLINQSLSVIIPTLNEAEHLPYTLNIVQTATNVETIIVDGGSLDATVKVATSLGARVISARAGRSHQMNLGANVAKGKILLFLHADTCLPNKFRRC